MTYFLVIKHKYRTDHVHLLTVTYSPLPFNDPDPTLTPEVGLPLYDPETLVLDGGSLHTDDHKVEGLLRDDKRTNRTSGKDRRSVNIQGK